MTQNCLHDINCLQWSFWWTVWCCRFSTSFCRETWPSPLLSQLCEFPQSAFVSWLHGTLGNLKYFSACTVNVQFTTQRVTASNPSLVWRNHQEAAQEGKLAQQHEAEEKNSAFQDGVGIGQEIGRMEEAGEKPALPSFLPLPQNESICHRGSRNPAN